MNQVDSAAAHASWPAAGDVVELMHVGERQPFGEATVTRVVDSRVIVTGESVPPGTRALSVRWWDERDAAWEITASVSPTDPLTGETTLRLVDPRRPALLRWAARVLLGREPVQLVTLGGDGRVIRRVQALCLDLSTGGCRVSGTGDAPLGGDILQVAAATGDLDLLVDARVVHVLRVPFGGWQAGIEFIPHTAGERADLARWRDSAEE